MTRPKVDPEKRQRTAQACDSCKRRKQKCNGLHPCDTCGKRSQSCSYTTAEGQPDEISPKKRRLTENDESVEGLVPVEGSLLTASPHVQRQVTPTAEWTYYPEVGAGGDGQRPDMYNMDDGTPSIESAARTIGLFPLLPQETASAPMASRDTSTTGNDEEAENHTMTRMLEDPTGRLLYVGDSATLSFLQLIRMMVESTSGPSSFTMDPQRHRIMENKLSVPKDVRLIHLLPDANMAQVLVESFFVNTHGLMQVFDRCTFLQTLEACYKDPLNTDPSWLCLLNLVFAIGLVLATPTLGSPEAAVINTLRRSRFDRSELFYLNAKSHNDPIIGFEDAGFWSVQALLLMAVYMLAVSKRNTAFAYFGMAVRSAYALGLHREETMVIFAPRDRKARRDLWRSLCVMDRFLAASLGRPAAISEDDCSGGTLESPNIPSLPRPGISDEINELGLQASVRSCYVIGIILRKIYQKRKISTKLAQEIADQCKLWPKSLHPSLHWRQATPSNPSQGIAILHVNLLYCHSIILLTRPFFLYLLHTQVQRARENHNQDSRQRHYRLEKFSEACLVASTHTIVLVYTAYEGRYLQRRNPFMIYFLFAATLIVLSNEFFRLYTNPTFDQCLENALTTMTYCAETDAQASRLIQILTTFRDVVNKSRHASQSRKLSPTHPMHNSLPEFLSPTQASTPASLRGDPSTFVSDIHTVSTPLQTPLGPSALGQTPPIGHNRGISFSNLLDFSNPSLALGSDSDAAPDEQIDFDSLWQWPGGGTPGGISTGATPGTTAWGEGAGGVQGVIDSTVPLFPTMETAVQP